MVRTITKACEEVDVSKPIEVATKCVVLLSGGLDSTVLMYSLLPRYEVWPLVINYGQRHRSEVVAAQAICLDISIAFLRRLKVLDLRTLGNLLPSACTGVGDIPEGHYKDESMEQTVVPNRNMILLAIAAGYAKGSGARLVAYAAHSGDHAIYPDCRPEFVSSIGKAIKLGTGGRVSLLVPFVNRSKAEIVMLGDSLGAPLPLTWSCYKGGKFHCGRCGTCVERKEAFEIAGVKDFTLYEDSP